MAGALGNRGLHVDFVDEGPWALSEVLDPDVAEPVHKALADRGVTIRMGTKVQGFVDDGNGRVKAVQTSNGELECDAVVVCLEKLPNTDLAQAAGIKLGTSGGVAVDEHMRTNRDGVWAAGDIIEVPHGLTMLPIHGLTGAHAYAQGRTAAFDIVGRGVTYDPVWIPWGMHAGDYTVGGFSIGESLAKSIGIPYVRRQGRRRQQGALLPGGGADPVKLLAEPGTLRLIGGQFHSAGTGVKERCDFLAFAAKRGATLEDLAYMENIYSPPIGALFEPMAIAAQNGLNELYKLERAAAV